MISANIEELTLKNNKGVNAWWQLLQYRIDIRTLLRTIANHLGERFEKDDVSYSKLLTVIVRNDKTVLPEKLLSNLNRIRANTHYLEWRLGPIPDNDDIKFVYDNAPGVIKELISIEKRLRGSTDRI